MQIVILAAGRGTRMGHLTDNCPKPMLKIKNKPILAHKIEALPREIDEVILVVGYLSEKIKEYFGNSYDGRRISYVVQEKLDSTGGAVKLVRDLVGDEFLVMNGDDLYVREDIEKIMRHKVAVLGWEVSNPEQFGIFKTDNGRVIDIIEKPNIPGPAFANIGLYKLTKEYFNYPLVEYREGEYGLPQTLVQMKDQFEIVIEKATNWFPIGFPQNLTDAEKIIDKFI